MDYMEQSDFLNSERIRILFERSLFSNVVAIIGAVIFSYLFRNQIDALINYMWLSFMILVAMVRFSLLFDYKKHKDTIINHTKYENLFSYLTGMVGIGWAIILYIGLTSEEHLNHSYGVLLFVALVSTSAIVFSTSKKTLYLYIVPPSLVTVPLLFLHGGDDRAIAIGLVAYIIMALRSSNDVYKTISDAIKLQSKSENLIEHLKQVESEKSTINKQMQDIMDFSPAAIYITDLDGRYMFLNKKVADINKLSHDEMIGKTLHDILTDDVADEIRKNDVEVITSLKTMRYEETIPAGDGLHYYLSIKFPLFNDKGIIYAVGGVSTDITERVKMEELNNLNQQRLLLHRKLSSFGVIEWNTEFEFLDWNPAAEKIFGFTKEEVEGKHITKCILPDSAREAVDDVWEKLITNTGGKYSLNENLTKDGRVIMCEWRNTPLLDHNGKVIGVTSMVEDITERKRQEESLRHTQKMDAVGKLTGGIAHDFNNMLGVILGFTQLLKARVNKEDTKLIKYCDQIFHAGENAKKLTSKLLQFSRKDTSLPEVTNINNLLEDMRHMLEKTLTARIDLKIDMEDDIYSVWLDKARLEDAVLNMSINSMHAMPDGGKLQIKTENVFLADTNKINLAAGNYVLLTISDTGIGMSEDVKAQIFDPFFTTKDEGGTGLGMSQVYGFIKQSAGFINIDSKVDEGTAVEIYFPEYKGVDNSDSSLAKLNKEQDIALLSGDETILVVDDETSLLLLATEILTKRGYTVFQAENAEQALEVLKRESIDLMLSDVIMPGMDGYQLAEEVNKLYPHIKIQMSSGFTGKANKNIKNIEYHENRLNKPWSDKEMLMKVRMLLDEAKVVS